MSIGNVHCHACQSSVRTLETSHLLKLLFGATFCTAAVSFMYALRPSILIGLMQSISFLALWWKSWWYVDFHHRQPYR